MFIFFIVGIPCQEVLSIKNIALIISSRGGHIGFMDGFLPATPFFSERLFEQYLKAIMSVKISEKSRNVFLWNILKVLIFKV